MCALLCDVYVNPVDIEHKFGEFINEGLMPGMV